ncbi:PAS domain-containing sensor histidine kinase [Porticoccus sp.]
MNETFSNRIFQTLDKHAIVSVCDIRGRIVYANDKFCSISGYSRDELLGENHRIIKSDCHPHAFYRAIWSTISGGKIWFGEICNKRKDGSLYWVESTIAPFMDESGKPYQYVSVRTDITDIKRSEQHLREQTSLLHFLNGAASNLLRVSPGELKPTVADLLGQLGQRLNCAGVVLWERSGRDEKLYPYSEWWLGKPLAGAPDQRLERERPAVGETAFYRQVQVNEFLQRDYYEIGHRAGCSGPYPEEAARCFPVEKGDGTLYVLQLKRADSLENISGDEVNALMIIADTLAATIRHRRAERYLEEHERLLQLSQYSARIGVWKINLYSRQVEWAENISSLLGRPEGTIERNPEMIRGVIHREDMRRISSAIKVSIRRNTPFEIEHRIILPDGGEKWILEKGSVLRDPHGKPMYLMGVMQDIDHKKRIEIALAKSDYRLRRANRLAQIGHWEIHLEKYSYYWSEEVYRIFGQEHGYFVPSRAAVELLFHPDDRAKAAGLFERGAEQELREELRIVHSSGEVRNVLYLSEPNVGINGYINKISGTYQDITDLKRTEQELIRARREAEKASLAKTEFLSRVSHELRTPMNAILGFGQLVDMDPELSEENKDNVSEILKAGHHLLGLINEVLDLSKVEAGRIGLVVETLDISALIEESLRMVRPLAEMGRVSLGHGELGKMLLLADKVRLKQVLINLLSNAIKYNKPNGHVCIDVRRVANDRVRILISDSGRGIPEEKLDELFVPFNRLDENSDEIEGTGIGLSITKLLIVMMDGDVGVQSKVGEGSTFWIELPGAEQGDQIAGPKNQIKSRKLIEEFTT